MGMGPVETPLQKRLRELREAMAAGTSVSGGTPTAGTASGTVAGGYVQQQQGVTPKPTDPVKTPGTPETIIETSTDDKNLTEATIFKLLEAGMRDEAQVIELLKKLGYDDEEATTLLALEKKGQGGAQTTLSPSTMFEALKQGALSADEVKTRLAEQGYDAKDIDVLMRINNKKDPAGTLNADFEAYNAGMLGQTEMYGRLKDRGYDDVQIRAMLKPDKTIVREGSRGSTGSGFRAPTEDARVQNAGGGGGGGGNARPRQILNDFRSAFSKSLQAQSAGLSMPAKQWAMDNMDSFLPAYLANAGQGGAFTVGAQQINTLYEGQRGTQRASGRAGAGVIQTRAL